MPRIRLAVLFALALPATSLAQSTPPAITLPTVIVTAQKEAEDVKTVPASVTAVTHDTIVNAGLQVVSDAAIFAPNTVFTEFTARKVSNARFRGIGSSPDNPAVTTYLDGVPQLNSNSSNVELLDVDQIEFVRGPQSPLFGRNTLGGIINVTSTRPSTTAWTGSVVAPFGDFGAKEVRGSVSGPIGDAAAVSFAVGKQEREGYTVNQVTGNDLDYRDGTFAKAQLMVTPNDNWQARVIYSHERNRDGDYALGDLGAIRATPFVVMRDFEGFTNRDINATTINVRGNGETRAIESTTGFVKWKTEDETDLDYTPLPLATRKNTEEDFQFTQEVRFASPRERADAAVGHGDPQVAGRRQVLQPELRPAGGQHPGAVRAVAARSVRGGAGLARVGDRHLGLRPVRPRHAELQREDRPHARPALRPRAERRGAEHVLRPGDRAGQSGRPTEASFSDVSPQFAVAFRPTADSSLYASASRGFKAGGFNAAALPGSEAYGEEHAWHLEGGYKSTMAGGRVSASAAVFSIDWDDLQLNVPNPFVPGQFYISNVGGARSSGVEFDLTARPYAASICSRRSATRTRALPRHRGGRRGRGRQQASLHPRLHRRYSARSCRTPSPRR